MSSAKIIPQLNDNEPLHGYCAVMTDRKGFSRASNWYLSEWLATTRTRQADLCRKTGWSPAKTSLLVNGRMDYTPKTVDEAAAALNINVYELFMQPQEAFAVRRFRESAVQLVAESARGYRSSP